MSPAEPVPFLDLGRGYRSHQPAIDAAIQGVLERGRFILADEVDAFEREFAAYVGVPHAVGVASGTDALHLALRAAGVGPGDEVITVANAGVPPVVAISMTGATPVFADVEADTLTMNAATVAGAITSRTRAILPVHLYGRCADLAPILELARRYALRVIEDCAQAAGATYGGARAGSLGDAGCVSFYPTKNLGAMGDGGMVVTRDAEIARRVRLARSYGEVARYEHVVKGFNSRLDELQAAILRARLPALDADNRRRRALAAAYAKGLASTRLGLPADDEGHVYHLFVVRVPRRDRFRQALSARGIATLVHYPTPVPRQPAYAEHRAALRHLTETERACADVVSLPMFPELTDPEMARVIGACVEAERCVF